MKTPMTTRRPKPPRKTVTAPAPAPSDVVPAERIQKMLARMGLGSRRAIEQWIVAGRLTVDGRTAVLGQRIRPAQAVSLDGKPLHTETRVRTAMTLMLHKPAGTVCTRSDPEQRPTVFQLLPRGQARQLIAVGRLDFNTAGLLLFTTDGELAHRLMHPSHQITREYAVRIFGKAGEDTLSRLLSGLDIDGERLAFDEIERQPSSGVNEWFICRLKTGRNREVRRLWESQGLTVSRLIRVRFGNLQLSRRLPAGRFAPIEGADLETLYRAVGLAAPGVEPPASKPPAKQPARSIPAPHHARRR